MHRKSLALVIVFGLAFHSAESLKCYMCNSMTSHACGDDPKKGNLEPIDCTSESMKKWSGDMKVNNALQDVASIFEADLPHAVFNLPKMACAKMDLQVAGTKVTLRSCQTAKTETVDSCRAIRSKLSNLSYSRVASMESCDLCDTDACNSATKVPTSISYLLLSLFGTLLVQALSHRIA